jgi:hypothetical protein
LFVQSMRDMSDAGRLNLQEVNTKFTQESSQTESAEQ